MFYFLLLILGPCFTLDCIFVARFTLQCCLVLTGTALDHLAQGRSDGEVLHILGRESELVQELVHLLAEVIRIRVEEGFLEFINNMLTTGMVPALYEQDEKDGLCNSVRAECKAAGISETPDNLWNFYFKYGQEFITILLNYLDPMQKDFLILTEENT